MNKHVFEKIAKLEKTELSEVKIDLALRDDIKSMYDKFVASKDAAMKAADKAENAVIEAYNQYANLAGYANAAANKVAEMKTKAKELGLNVDAEILNIEKAAKDGIKSTTAQANQLKTTAGQIAAIKSSK